ELTFKGLTNSPVTKVESSITYPFDFANDTEEIDKLFESDPSVPNQQIMHEQLNNNPMIQPTTNYYRNR
ncbi:unnamed protein product, partial [Rotaria magnacalcarata]